jgi:hypothetical protein
VGRTAQVLAIHPRRATVRGLVGLRSAGLVRAATRPRNSVRTVDVPVQADAVYGQTTVRVGYQPVMVDSTR